jgi:hypothetical protein
MLLSDWSEQLQRPSQICKPKRLVFLVAVGQIGEKLNPSFSLLLLLFALAGSAAFASPIFEFCI